MEIQTCFNLNAAIKNWHEELAAQPGLAPEDRRELESHLCDSLAELRQRGLNEEECFWLARRRLGPPPQLAEEFVKEDPVRVWRKRLFWMALALLTVQIWNEAVRTAFGLAGNFNRFLPEWVVFYLPLWLQHRCREAGSSLFLQVFVCYLPFVALLVAFARGRVSDEGAAMRPFLRSRWRFLLATTLVVLGVHLFNVIVYHMTYPIAFAGPFAWQFFYLPATTSLGLVGILAWGLPSEANNYRVKTR